MTGPVPLLSGTDASISQACVVVADMEAAVRHHLSIAEAGEFRIWTCDSEYFATSSYRGAATPYASRIAINTVRPQLEYVELIRGPSVFHEHVEEHGFGLHHLGVLVDDVQRVMRDMATAGYATAQHHTGWGLDGDGEAAFFDTRAALGYWLEAVSPPTRRRPPELVLTGADRIPA